MTTELSAHRLIPSRCLCGAVAVSPVGAKDGRPVGRCARCGLLRTCSVPEDYLTLYTSGDVYHAGRPGHVPYRDRFDHDRTIAALRWPKLLSEMRLLDVGCANGAFVRHAAEQGVSAEGVEINPGMAAWARDHCDRPIHRSWDTVRGPFDVITYHDVIEHVVNPVAELTRAREFLRPGGLIVIDTPDADDPRFERLGLSWHHMKPQEHLWFFSERHLRGVIERAGFRIDQVDRPIEGKIVMYARRVTRRRGGAMSNRIRTLTNAAAHRKSEAELEEILVEVFSEVEGRQPRPDEQRGLHEAAEWVKTNQIRWALVEDGLRDRTWTVEDGPRDLYGPA